MTIYQTARELAVPVVRGQLSHTHAHAALLVATLRAERDGVLGRYKAPDVFDFAKYTLAQAIEREASRRGDVSDRIHHRIAPLVARRKPSNVLLAEAHDVNGASGFTLTEEEVTDIVARHCYRAMGRRQRHV